MRSNKKHILISSFTLCCLLLLFSCHYKRLRVSSKTNNIDKREIVSLAKGTYCEIESDKDIVISSNNKWKHVWEKIHKGTFPPPELPEVDFTEETVLAVFLGTRPTGGYNIEISHITEDEGKTEVIVKTKSPKPGEMVTMAITRPFHVVKVNIADKDFEYLRK